MTIHFVVLMLLVVLAAQAQLYRMFGHARLTYARYWSETSCTQGDAIEMVEVLANAKPLPLPWLRVESQLHPGIQFKSTGNLTISRGTHMQNHMSFFSVKPYSRITRRHKVTCTKRGVYKLEQASLTCGDLIGLHVANRRFALGGELVVYPKPISPSELDFPFHSWQGELSVRRWIVPDPFMLAGTRDYAPGDSLRSVNWKASARTGTLQVHRLDYTADPHLHVLLNMEDRAELWTTISDRERIEHGIASAAGFARYALGLGMEVGFSTNGQLPDRPREAVQLAPQAGEGQWKRLNDTFARLELELAEPFVQLLAREANQLAAAGRRKEYIVITAFVSGAMEEQLERLRALGHHVEIVWLQLPDQQGQRGQSA